MIRRFLALAALTAVFTASLSAPASVLGDAPIPPLRPDGPVVLPDGRVLPVKPASLHEASVQAEMLAAHASDQIQFTPGDRPQPIGPPDATLSLFTGSTDFVFDVTGYFVP